MRIVTFNILHGRSPSDGRVDVERFADAISSLDADVLALQEVDRDQPRSHGADLTAVAADAMGARDYRFVPAMTGHPDGSWRAASGNEPPGTPLYGVALLTRYQAHDWREMRLPALRPKVPYTFRPGLPRMVKDETRVAVRASIETPLGRVVVVGTHLSFLPGWNSVQLRRVKNALYQNDDRLILVGDLNMQSDRARKLTAMRPLARALTFPADQPSRQIDHILARGLEVAGPSSAIRLAVSDHRALAVDLAV